MVLVAVLDNRWGEEELAAKLGRVLDLNGRRNGLERPTVGILAQAIQAVNGKQARVGSIYPLVSTQSTICVTILE